ncbi:MAG: T9SS type A sorting domain-containing protein [Bacteroidia bacterium]|nr:T9SS type A sorting domain-containing protein [Bacteroidia bacterium]
MAAARHGYGFTLAWRLNEPGAAWYQLALPAAVTTFTLPQLLPNRNYLFRIRARCGQIVGSWSGEQGFSTSASAGRLAASASVRETSVYPNPNDGVFVVHAAAATLLTLFDAHGKVVETRACEANAAVEFGTSRPFSAGVYLLRGQTSDGVWTRKIVVQ